MTLLELENITKTYEINPPIPVLRGINLCVDEGQKILIVGHSGAGKSTLLNILGLLDQPSGGKYFFAGQHVENLAEHERDQIRGNKIGFVFQDFHVLSHRTVRQNLELKLSINQVPREKREGAINAALKSVGLKHRADVLARFLSGGEKQRLAFARAVITRPELILADEPTGNLDLNNAKILLALLSRETKRGVTAIVISHDERLRKWADRTWLLDKGVLHSE